MKPHDDMETQ